MMRSHCAEDRKPFLLVDDAAPLRGLTRLLLEGCGYTVLDSGDPADAIHIAERPQGPLAAADHRCCNAWLQRPDSCRTAYRRQA